MADANRAIIHSIFERSEDGMARRRDQQGKLYIKGPSWLFRYRVDRVDPQTGQPMKDPVTGNPIRDEITVRIGPAKGSDKLRRIDAWDLAQRDYIKTVNASSRLPNSMRTFAEFVEERFKPDLLGNYKPSWKASFESLLKVHINPALGDVRMRDLSMAHVQNFLTAKGTVLSSQTVKHLRNCLSKILKHAKRMGWFAGEIPTEEVSLPRMKRVARRALTWEQVCAIARHLKEPLATLVPFLAVTGLRIGEAKGLRWRYVNLTAEDVIVEQMLLPKHSLLVIENYVRGEYGTLKTSSSARIVPIPEWFLAAMEKLHKESKWQAPECPVFANGAGNPIDDRNMSVSNLKQAAALAGMGTLRVPGKIGGRGDQRRKRVEAKSWVTWHCLRVTNATLADQAGLTVTERQRILGHASGLMAMHYTKADLNLTRERFEKLADPKLLM